MFIKNTRKQLLRNIFVTCTRSFSDIFNFKCNEKSIQDFIYLFSRIKEETKKIERKFQLNLLFNFFELL